MIMAPLGKLFELCCIAGTQAYGQSVVKLLEVLPIGHTLLSHGRWCHVPQIWPGYQSFAQHVVWPYRHSPKLGCFQLA